jgi:hypothetical protein
MVVADFIIQPWMTFSCIAADNLRRGSPVSVGYRSLRHDKSLAEIGVKWHTLAILDELSLLRHGERPAYPGAEVTFILPHKRIPRTAQTPPAEKPPKTEARERSTELAASTTAAGEEIIHGGPIIRRPGIGRVLGVR